jgi:hypothetical protein
MLPFFLRLGPSRRSAIRDRITRLQSISIIYMKYLCLLYTLPWGTILRSQAALTGIRIGIEGSAVLFRPTVHGFETVTEQFIRDQFTDWGSAKFP